MIEGVHRLLWAALTFAALLLALQRREHRRFALYLGLLGLSELARSFVEPGGRLEAHLRQALYLLGAGGPSLLAFFGLELRQRWAAPAAVALSLGAFGIFAVGYPLGPLRMAVAWIAIAGVSSALGLWAASRGLRRRPSFEVLLFLCLLGGELAQVGGVLLGVLPDLLRGGPAELLLEAWPRMRRIAAAALGAALSLYALRRIPWWSSPSPSA